MWRTWSPGGPCKKDDGLAAKTGKVDRIMETNLGRGLLSPPLTLFLLLRWCIWYKLSSFLQFKVGLFFTTYPLLERTTACSSVLLWFSTQDQNCQPWYGHSFKLSQGFAEYAKEDLEQAWVEVQQAIANLVNILWRQKLWPEPVNLGNEKQGKRRKNWQIK